MSKKSDLKRAILDSEKEIGELENKIRRSQTALLQSILNDTKLNEQDAQYFRLYTSLIEVERENLRKLKNELNTLESPTGGGASELFANMCNRKLQSYGSCRKVFFIFDNN